jgi:hypothetical protein
LIDSFDFFKPVFGPPVAAYPEMPGSSLAESTLQSASGLNSKNAASSPNMEALNSQSPTPAAPRISAALATEKAFGPDGISRSYSFIFLEAE